MLKILSFAAGILLCTACATKKIKSPDSLPKAVELGYMQTYDSLPLLDFEPMDEADFVRLPPATISPLPTLKQNDSVFFVPFQKFRVPFKHYRSHPSPKGHAGNTLEAFYPKFDLYAINQQWTAESMGFGEMLLLDSQFGHTYKIISVGDGAISGPHFSPDHRYLLYFYNFIYENKDCFIGICKVNPGKRDVPSEFIQEWISYPSSEWAVEEIRWINQETFAVQGYENRYDDRADEWVKIFSHWKATIRGN